MKSITRTRPRTIITHLTVAGAAVLIASAADAQVIVTQVNRNIGFVPGDFTSVNLSGLPGVNPKIFAAGFASSNTSTRAIVLSNTSRFKCNEELLGPGIKFSTVGGTSPIIGPRVFFAGASAFNHFADPLYSNEYYAFEFTTASGQTDFGWLETSLTGNTFSTLNLDVVAYAYDASGAQLPTGSTVSAAPPPPTVPEPDAAAALAALSCVALGAAGVRRLKAAAARRAL